VNRKLANSIAIGALWAAAIVTVSVLFALIAYVFINGISQISLQFIFGFPHGVNSEGGIFPTIWASVYVTALAMVIVTPVAILAAVYLTEYAHQGRVVRTIRFAADSLAAIPSIVMGLFGLAFFVEAMHFGFSMLSGALALSFLMLPIVMRATEEAIRAVPRYIRWGSYGLGATKWQTVRRVVLPAAAPRILTGIILATGRAVGETAVVLYTMGTMFNVPITPLDPGRSMPVNLYILSTEGTNLPSAYGTALVLMVMILGFNLTANWMVRRSRRMYE
jgi:phosphate transport system permease protein